MMLIPLLQHTQAGSGCRGAPELCFRHSWCRAWRFSTPDLTTTPFSTCRQWTCRWASTAPAKRRRSYCPFGGWQVHHQSPLSCLVVLRYHTKVAVWSRTDVQQGRTGQPLSRAYTPLPNSRWPLGFSSTECILFLACWQLDWVWS